MELAMLPMELVMLRTKPGVVRSKSASVLPIILFNPLNGTDSPVADPAGRANQTLHIPTAAHAVAQIQGLAGNAALQIRILRNAVGRTS